MNEIRAFGPAYQRTGPGATPAGTWQPGVIVAAANGSSTASTVLPGVSGNNVQVQFRVANKTSVWVHVNFGVLGAVRAAALTDPGIPPASIAVFSVDPEVTGAAVWADGAPAGSTSVVFHRGTGL